MQRTNQSHCSISFGMPANVREWCANVFTWMPCCFSYFKNIHCLISGIGNCILFCIFWMYLLFCQLFVARCSLLVDVFVAIGPEFMCCTDLLYRAKIYVGNDYLTELPQSYAMRKLKTKLENGNFWFFCVSVFIGNYSSDSFKAI